MKKMTNDVITLALSFNNPFGIVDRNGRLMKFDYQTEAYLFVLLDLYKTFPRGFVDVYLYIYERQFRGKKAAEEVMKNTGEYVVIDWHKSDLEKNEKLHETLNILLGSTGSVIDRDVFTLALQHFYDYVEKDFKDHPEFTNIKSQIFYL